MKEANREAFLELDIFVAAYTIVCQSLLLGRKKREADTHLDAEKNERVEHQKLVLKGGFEPMVGKSSPLGSYSILHDRTKKQKLMVSGRA